MKPKTATTLKEQKNCRQERDPKKQEVGNAVTPYKGKNLTQQI